MSRKHHGQNQPDKRIKEQLDRIERKEDKELHELDEIEQLLKNQQQKAVSATLRIIPN